MIRKLKAFSLVELMMILLVASLIIAAIAPVVTKKHFRLPSIVNHGAYMCYYENGQLREAKWAGKFQQQELFNRATDNCVFTPPKKAAYFQISAIGGGGGGGDAGYTGGNWVSSDGGEQPMSPFGVTVEALKNAMDLDDVPASEIPAFINEWKSYAGHLMGYAKSTGSGAGGAIGKMTTSSNEICHKYVTEKVKYCAEHQQHENVTVGEAQKDEEGNTTYLCSWNDCTQTKTCDTCEREVPYTWTTGGECLLEDSYDCTGTHTETYDCQPTPYPCFTSSCSGSGTMPGANSGTDAGGGCANSPSTCYGEPQCKTRTVKNTPTQYCQTCVSHAPTVTHNGTRTEYYDCNCSYSTNCTPGSTTVTSTSDCTGSSGTCVRYDYYDKTTSKCEEGMLETQWTWHHSMISGESGGSGVSCQSSTTGTPGGLNLPNPVYEITYFGTGKDGSDIDTSAGGNSCFGPGEGEQGYAICADGSQQHSCSSPSYASAQITGADGSVESVKALSASSGGGGGNRGTSTDAAGHCVDTTLSTIHRATDGSCAAGETATTCSGSGSYGYCLKHHYGTVEPNGLYKFKYGYDQNYLGYGAAGSPGQFKTTVVRSLSDMDLTIKVGRGGSAAAVNSGLAGAKGSATSMGEIIKAEGGNGGVGNLKQTSETLPTYNKERHDKESLCYYYNKYTEKNPDHTYRDNSPEAIELRNKLTTEPGYCSGMVNNQGAYKFYKIAGNKTGAYPTPTGVFSTFMNVAFSSSSSSDLFNKFIKFGRGGTGGGVEHRCWAGRHDIIFEGVTLSASVFVDKASATAYAIAHNKYVPDGCREEYDNIPASPGVDGALLIKW